MLEALINKGFPELEVTLLVLWWYVSDSEILVFVLKGNISVSGKVV
ncbi:hypothetical protein [Clostridium saccharobutylicum]|uniref:Uncharacterized protein n=1 Tax=Clostridium saccharobutylicum DSM 13864 TaxID=1345695 RepID=U5MR85_CLOSA|nr:hypothetical protein [Clostridium saccharobutylicum]AGX41912.1 hypothetical protein CLSA_c09000 [Clostridium saccharobutylicum DSM 13864]MBA2907789.1 hypothetical protein [Clostridium saccharobutylicum]MBA8792322.1 hypothetical protein [Clostridium saccharobutylicum]MBA8899069.1 hypothetical protein [Clostridium saccharobutylicum]MBA8981959.1 hypothetical protein [Clostridium saccharobutylicum]